MKRSLILSLAMSAAVAAPIAASAQQWNGPDRDDYGNRGNSSDANVNRSGYIASLNGSSFQLGDGTTVFMHRGTVIEPTGLSLRNGMIVRISGYRDGRGRINATEIDWNHGWNRSDQGYRHRDDGDDNH